MNKYYTLILIALLISCNEEKTEEIKMIDFKLTKKDFSFCFDQNMNGYKVGYFLIKKDSSKSNDYKNVFLTTHTFLKNDSCCTLNLVSWDDRTMDVENLRIWQSIKVEDFKEVRYFVTTFSGDSIYKGTYYP